MSGNHVLDPSGRDRPSVYPLPASTPTSPAYAAGQHNRIHANNDGQIYSLPSDPVPCGPKAASDRAFEGFSVDPGAGRSGWQVPKRSASPAKRNAPPFQYKESPRTDGYHILTPGPVPFSSPFTSSPAQRSLRTPYHVHEFGSPSYLPPSPSKETYPEPSPEVRFLSSLLPRPSRSPATYDSLRPGSSKETNPNLGNTSKADTSPPNAAKKLGFLKRTRNRFRRHRPASPPNKFSPGNRSSPCSESTSQISCSRGPTPSHGLGLSISQGGFSDQKARKPNNCQSSEVARNSQDSSKTIVAQPYTPIYTTSPVILTSPTWKQGESRDSASTLVEPSDLGVVDTNPLSRFHSKPLKDTANLEPLQFEASEVQEEWVELPPLLPDISERCPVPSYLLDEKTDLRNNQDIRAQRFRCRQEQDASLASKRRGTYNSFSDILPPLDRSRFPPGRTQSERAKVTQYLSRLPNTPESAPDTPKQRQLKETYTSLCGIRPTTSVFWDWGLEADDQASVCYPDHPVAETAKHFESRGREVFHRSQDFRGESIRGRDSFSPGRRHLKEDPFRSREGAGEAVINKFLAEETEADNVRSFASVLTPQSTPCAAKYRQHARNRFAGAAVYKVITTTKEKSLNSASEETQPPGHQWCGTTPQTESWSDHRGKVDGRSGISLRPNTKLRPKELGNRQASALHKYSPKDHEIVVCTRSKTGTVKELPLTPANKRIIKAVLQSESGYTDSVYSVESRSSTRTNFPELKPSPLSLEAKTPSPLSSDKAPYKSDLSYEKDPFRTANAIIAECLSGREGYHLPKMETLQVSSALRSSTKAKAEEDARIMQKTVIESCKKAGRDPPKYVLLELIGKGSFGRVYKGKDINTTNIVAVKIIDIDESDTLNPRLADTYSEIMKEVNALKILSASKAKNINHVIEALPVGTAMWMITEYCGGGSIATLMKPTPDGLKERFIIPILREVAEAVKWVHQAGIIHRDLKCANILITEEGGVQLCDFGVAGITETAVDKRSTFIGTFHWMAPELFRGSSYGTEIDIWAFGSMTYEMATGLPPNAMSGVNGMELGAYLKTHIPRLEGDAYSEGLKSIVAFCLEENPNDRPSIEAVQRHQYIYNSNTTYPSSDLSDLVKAFKMWESHGGSRKSLFGVGGAQGPSELSSTALSDDCWNFSTTPAFDLAVEQAADPQDIINVYGASVALGTDFADDTSRPVRQQQGRATRRRPPPEALAPLKAPLEKLFDPNTMSNYKDNAISHFNLQPSTASDLPLRDDSEPVSIRDTLIDLDAHDLPSGLSSFAEMDTMKPARRAAQADSDEGFESGVSHDFSRPALSDPVDNPNRRTQDWKFPSMAPPASANPEFSRFPVLQRPNVTPGSGARPALVHHPTEPIGLSTQGSHSLGLPASSSDRMSLIDLDMSIPEPSRPSTADSSASQDNASANPFMWERHVSIYHAQNQRSAREPSLYLDDPSGLYMRASNNLQDLAEVSDFSASDAESYHEEQYNGYQTHPEGNGNEAGLNRPAAGELRGGYDPSGNSGRALWESMKASAGQNYRSAFHPLPPPPSAAVLSGTASYEELRSESHRMFDTLKTSLETFRAAYETMPTRPAKGSQGTSGDDSQGGSSSHETGSNIS